MTAKLQKSQRWGPANFKDRPMFEIQFVSGVEKYFIAQKHNFRGFGRQCCIYNTT